MDNTHKPTIESIAYYSRLPEREIYRATKAMEELDATDRMKRAIFVFKASPRFSRYGSETDYCLKDAANLTGVSSGQLSVKLNEWENN